MLHSHDNAPHLSLTSGLQEIIPKQEHGAPSATATSSSSDTKKLLADKIKARKYRCTECAQVFPLLKLRREHMIQDHGHNHPLEVESRLLCSAKIKTEGGLLSSAVASSSTSTGGITQDIFSDLANTQRFIIKQIKDATTTELEEHSSVTKYKTKINRILMDYNLLNHELQLNAADPTVTQETKLDSLRRQLNELGKSTQYTCITCRAEFPTLRLFDQHMNVHPGECYTCGRTFKHWSNFALHIKRHLGIRNYVCRACHKGFVVRQKLIEHLRTHTGHAPIKCNLCNERFRRYSNLVQHRNRHHLNKRPPKADFVCHCGEVFNSKAKVEWHAEIHDTKPKNCPHCRERFIHRNSLTRHIRLSHPEKYDFVKKDTHQCPVCLKKFVASSIKVSFSWLLLHCTEARR
jgi:DNA-directed RNA polymerase subunit RPC12/RpoP